MSFVSFGVLFSQAPSARDASITTATTCSAVMALLAGTLTATGQIVFHTAPSDAGYRIAPQALPVYELDASGKARTAIDLGA